MESMYWEVSLLTGNKVVMIVILPPAASLHYAGSHC